MTEKYHTITLTDNELAIVREALAMKYDIDSDTWLDSLSAFSFWLPAEQQCVTVTREVLNQTRDELYDRLDNMLTLHGLKIKLGIEDRT